MSRINVMQPWMGEQEIAAVADVIRSGWVAQGPRVAQFEEAFAQRMGVQHAVAVTSCTTALHLALIVAGVESGDDVVVPSFSFIATANAPTYVGAHPVFADVDAGTGNITADTIKAALTKRTRAVIAVDQGGVPCEIVAIRSLCDPLGITVIEDAACGAGSTYGDSPVGAGSEIACWSFHPRKILTTGEGGMITTNRQDWADRARHLREHAMSVSAADRHATVLPPAEEYTEIGYNFRMTDLQGALGLVQLGRLDEVVARRRELAARYDEELSGIPGLHCVADPALGTSNFQSFWVEVGEAFPISREDLLAVLAKADISARRGIMAAHRQPAYAGQLHSPLPITERLSDNTLILPLFHQMTSDELNRVVQALLTPTRR